MEIQSKNIKFNQSESDSLFQASTRQSLFNEAVQGAMELAAEVNPYSEILPEGVVIPTLDAVNWSCRNVDIRPRLVDKSNGKERLVDSGAQITATVRLPEDKPDMVQKSCTSDCIPGSKTNAEEFSGAPSP